MTGSPGPDAQARALCAPQAAPRWPRLHGTLASKRRPPARRGHVPGRTIRAPPKWPRGTHGSCRCRSRTPGNCRIGRATPHARKFRRRSENAPAPPRELRLRCARCIPTPLPTKNDLDQCDSDSAAECASDTYARPSRTYRRSLSWGHLDSPARAPAPRTPGRQRGPTGP